MAKINDGMTLDEVLAELEGIRPGSNLKGKAMVLICVQGEEYIPIKWIKVENDPSGGGVILIMPSHEPVQITK